MTRNTSTLTAVAAVLLGLSLASCASNKAREPATAANQPADAAAKSADAAAEKAAKKDPGPQALGYTILNKKGEPLYCKQIRPTGSNVARTTKCMTAKEWQNSHQDNQRTLEELRRGFDYPK